MPTHASFQSHLQRIVDELSTLVANRCDTPHQLLFQAARYSLLSPGKRLRPLLVLATAEAYGVPFEKALLPACALELVHTYSLIHDDLPCMDNDDMRRGKPTLHKVYPEGQAVLAGDFLLTYAFQVLSEAPFLSPEQKVQLIYSLSYRSGGDGMIGGQVVDLLCEGKSIDWHTLRFMHFHKTASLLIACLEFGGILAEVSKEEMDLLRKMGEDLGLAFQIVDDLLDAQENSETTDSDQIKQKATAVTLLGKEKAKLLSEELFASVIYTLDSLSKPAPKLRSLAHQLIFRNA